MVLPFSGPGGQYGPSAQAVTELAIEDINATGGMMMRAYTRTRRWAIGKPESWMAGVV